MPTYLTSENVDDHNNSSFIEKNSADFGYKAEEKKQLWKMIQGMVQRGQFNDAFIMALNSDDEMLLIRLLSKTGCKITKSSVLAFEYEKLYEQQREELLRKAVCLLEGKEFCEILIPCIGEVVERFNLLMSKGTKEWLWQRL